LPSYRCRPPNGILIVLPFSECRAFAENAQGWGAGLRFSVYIVFMTSDAPPRRLESTALFGDREGLNLLFGQMPM
jgi:hypothetical protein